MSEAQRENSLIGSSTAGSDDAGHPSSTGQSRQRVPQQYAPAAGGTLSQVTGGPLPSMQLPPMRQGSQESVDDQLLPVPVPVSRTSVLPSLLNPSPGQAAVPSRRRKFDEFDSPPMSDAALPPIMTRPQTMRSPVSSRRPSVPDFRGNLRQDCSSALPGSPKRSVTHSLMTSNPPT
ncbi:hypothetical protein B0A51_18990, partial [Rachicladosporium sp. CCFEE 5018]